MVTIEIAKTKDNAVIPFKRYEDAGYDVYACFDDDYLILEPNETKMISTGICSTFDPDYVVVLKERGSTGAKGMGIRAGIIDSNFRGEWKVMITNHNYKPLAIVKSGCPLPARWMTEDFVLYQYEKAICQALVLPVPEVKIKPVSYEHIILNESNRGDKMLGSTNK